LIETQVTATFDKAGKRVGGSGGCNSYGASYVIDGNQINISDIVSTKKACAPPIGTQENTYFQLLKGAGSFRIENNRLTIFSGNDVLNYSKE
jgi:heat shock protein HslJ